MPPQSLALVTFSAAPEHAAISPRCHSELVVGVTVESCVSADLNCVYGHSKLYVNAAGLGYFPPGATGIDVESYIYYWQPGASYFYAGPGPEHR